MALTISVDLDELSVAQKEFLAGFIMNYPESFKDEEPKPAETAGTITGFLDPAAAFGPVEISQPAAAPAPPSPTQVVSQLGPVLVIPAPPATVTLDKSGLPWDARIHASSKAMNANGTWRGKRGVLPAVITNVEAELRQVLAIPAPSPAPGTTAAAPPPPPASTADVEKQYIDLFGRASSAMSAGKLTQEQLQKCCEAVGLPSFPMLGNRLDLVAPIAQLIDGIIAGQSA